MTTLDRLASVSLNYATKTVTGPAGAGNLSFGDPTGSDYQEGDVISFGVKTKPGVYISEMPLLSLV